MDGAFVQQIFDSFVLPIFTLVGGLVLGVLGNVLTPKVVQIWSSISRRRRDKVVEKQVIGFNMAMESYNANALDLHGMRILAVFILGTTTYVGMGVMWTVYSAVQVVLSKLNKITPSNEIQDQYILGDTIGSIYYFLCLVGLIMIVFFTFRTLMGLIHLHSLKVDPSFYRDGEIARLKRLDPDFDEARLYAPEANRAQTRADRDRGTQPTVTAADTIEALEPR